MVSSRIRLEALTSDIYPDREVWVGWDHGMQSYFAQVFDGVDGQGEDVVTVDAGNLVSQYTHPDDLAPLLRDYANIPDDVRDQLIADRDADMATSPDLSSEPGDIARRALLGDPDAVEIFFGHPEDDGLDEGPTDTSRFGYGSSF